MKKILLSLCLMPVLSFADPAPFGLELGKATISDAKKLYSLDETGTNKFTGGAMFNVSTNQINFDGLQELTLIFDQQEKLSGVLTTLPKEKFDSLYSSLNKKYQLVKKERPFVGNQYAEYSNGGSKVFLDAPHLSFQMSMNYLRKDLISKYEAATQAEASAKKKSEESQL